MLIPVILLGAAVLGGLTLLTLRIVRKKNPPKPVAVIHGLAALSGFVALIIAVLTDAAPRNATFGIYMVGVTAMAGSYMLYLHLRERRIPPQYAVIHGLMGLGTFAFLLMLLLES